MPPPEKRRKKRRRSEDELLHHFRGPALPNISAVIDGVRFQHLMDPDLWPLPEGTRAVESPCPNFTLESFEVAVRQLGGARDEAARRLAQVLVDHWERRITAIGNRGRPRLTLPHLFQSGHPGPFRDWQLSVQSYPWRSPPWALSFLELQITASPPVDVETGDHILARFADLPAAGEIIFVVTEIRLNLPLSGLVVMQLTAVSERPLHGTGRRVDPGVPTTACSDCGQDVIVEESWVSKESGRALCNSCFTVAETAGRARTSPACKSHTRSE